jgi:RNA polymerase sigma factor (sigma-70 family)
MKEYRVKITVRNNLLLSAIENAGYKSQTDFAQAAELAVQTVNSLVGLRVAPINSEGDFIPAAKVIMEVLGAAPTDLWTEEQLTMSLRRNTGERNVDGAIMHELLENNIQAMTLPSPEYLAMAAEKSRVVESVLDTLTEAERETITRHTMGEETLNEVAVVRGVSTERIRQIEAKALRKIRGYSINAIEDVK